MQRHLLKCTKSNTGDLSQDQIFIRFFELIDKKSDDLAKAGRMTELFSFTHSGKKWKVIGV